MNTRKVIILVVIILFTLGSITIGISPSDSIQPLKAHENSVKRAIDLVEQGKKEAALELLDSLHAALITARANLRGWTFEGESNRLTDPFMLPGGVYRVHFTTEGFGTVKVIEMSGDVRGFLFNLAQGRASEGASTIYKSDGKQIMLQFVNITAPYELIVEKLE